MATSKRMQIYLSFTRAGSYLVQDEHRPAHRDPIFYERPKLLIILPIRYRHKQVMQCLLLYSIYPSLFFYLVDINGMEPVEFVGTFLTFMYTTKEKMMKSGMVLKSR